MKRDAPNSAQSLLRNLAHELFQTETSAARHCRREARRLGDAPPAQVLLTAAQHAEAVLRDLPGLAARNGLPVSGAGKLLGALFSEARQRVADHLIEAERSYRGTLLGMRHGADLVRLMRHVASAANASEVVAFCDGWLSVREPLIAQTEEQLAWFASHSERASELARPLPLIGRARQA
jgi:hypothetical protein